MKYSDIGTVFGAKYHAEGSDWGGHSGGGSLPYYTIAYRAFIESFLSLNRIQKVIDIGCGDWQFSKFINYDSVIYTGYDIVPSVVARNNEIHARDNIKFLPMPVDHEDLDDGDLLIVKDVLQHLPNEMIFHFMDDICPKYRYCLITNSYSKIDAQKNVDINPGEFRCLDLNSAPYSVNGTYVLEYFSPLWETIRVLLVRPRAV